ncbi:hypothetical protein DMW62_21705 [Serratia marcescens]|uniref:Prophage protein n=1 Tax=Serratia marcescens TaxID=615 RepID=A0AB33G5U8_SERMA|nr:MULTISPECIES: hypothetical protein [Serratia]AKL42419.1 prophage protein [Serratia marcescens]AWL69726.1 hypothetical protein DKC05_19750 [Serratia marcescens]MDI9108889.1 hypothetical protein [Serratia marcescens]MDR8489257.1 hypothetical protein [Serratia nevei]MDR8536553.1 hypothetical protein [Serratia nevei]
MSKSNLVAFRVPADLQDAFNQAVAASGGDKSAWLVDAIRSKLNRPVADSDKRMLALVERMETAAAALIVGRSGIPPHPYNEKAVIAIVAQTIGEGLDNGRIIAERLNDAGHQTKDGKAWDKDIYSAWKRQGNNSLLIANALAV